jgi:C4-dicarboxylate transporter DctQ subunit
MLRSLNRLLLFIEDKVFPNIAVVFFSISVVWMMIEALSRQIFHRSYAISEELITFCILWAVLLTLGQAGKQGHHINIDLLVQRLPSPVVRILNLSTMLLGFIFALCVFYSAVKYLPHLFTTDVRSASPMRLPLWLIFIAIPISSILMMLYYLRELFAQIKAIIALIMDRNLEQDEVQTNRMMGK